MEFGEKLQKLRKDRGLTQEELAEALYVSRTAVSKWESGRGYPGIDSLKEISRFFGVTIDGLMGADEILSAAEQEKERLVGRYTSFICSALDILTVILLFIPVFGNGDAAHSAVSLTGLTAVSPWVRIFFTVVIIVTVLNGVCGAVISRLDRPAWNRHRLLTGIGLSVIGTAVFLMTRQPYAGILCLAVLVIKITLLLRGKDR
ncbi:MAG: helix-turn-helix transcriptional regulator [Lachnospiraceae bacterium]|nr:helix-turn-helix transcriptional regulator [Lachnospiraceae bacterium]